jgi:hypothetical protein
VKEGSGIFLCVVGCSRVFLSYMENWMCGSSRAPLQGSEARVLAGCVTLLI